MSESQYDLINRADLDGLIRLIDDYCETRSWHDLLGLRDACKAAVANGRQVWPASTLAEYRLALLAPAEIAVQVVGEQAGRFTMGPLTEVIAQNHQWSELSELLEPSPTSTYIAYECAIRGQSVEDELFPALESPLALLPMEANYALAEYHDNEAKFPTPALPEMGSAISVPASTATIIHDSSASTAFHQLADAWTTQSNGKLRLSCIEGSVLDALAALDIQEARLSLLTPGEALAWLTWAGASGGAHGRRRGNALGRDAAWWTIAALTGQTSLWPLTDDAFESAADSLQWFWWDANEPTTGWNLQLCVHHAERNRSWALCLNDIA
ncbi:MAG: hypothetical protein ACKOE0_02000 [Actinomycetes bacterium]